MKRCPDCRALLLEVPGERYTMLLDKDPDPIGDVVMEASQTGARRARVLGESEKVKPGTTLWARHSQTCKAKRKKRQPRETDQRELAWQPCKEA